MSVARIRALITRTWQETPRLKGVLIDPPSEVTKAHTVPGQYIVANPSGGKKVYLVISSRPGAAPLELLLGEAADRTLGLEQGMEIEIEPPAGKGYPMEVLKGRDVLLFSAGSALASLRPVIALIRESRSEFGRVALFAGAHTAGEFPYAREYDDWRRDRIDIYRAISRPWVQDLFVQEKLDVANAAAFVCGGKQMMDDVTGVLVHAGVPSDLIRRNF